MSQTCTRYSEIGAPFAAGAVQFAESESVVIAVTINDTGGSGSAAIVLTGIGRLAMP